MARIFDLPGAIEAARVIGDRLRPVGNPRSGRDLLKAQDDPAGAPQEMLDRGISNCDARTSVDARGL